MSKQLSCTLAKYIFFGEYVYIFGKLQTLTVWFVTGQYQRTAKMSYYLALTILILSVIQGNISSYVYADEGGIPIMHWRKSSREQPNVLTALSKLSSQDISSASTSLDSIQYNISQTIRVCALASSSTCADVEMLSSLLSVLVHGQSKKE